MKSSRDVRTGERATRWGREHGDARARARCGIDVHDARADLGRAALLEEGRGDVWRRRAQAAPSTWRS
jgi:hypothetical protein